MLNPPVGVTTQDYIDALKADSPVHVRMSFPTQGITLEDQDIMITGGLTLSDILNGDIDLVFGKSVMKQLTVNIINSSRVHNLLWTEEFTLEFGVEINNVVQYVKLGDFTGEKPDNITTAEEIVFTAYDRMQKFDVLADEFWGSVTFPATVEEIYHALCDYVGIGYVSGDELPYIMSRTFTIAPMQLQGYTCRDILSWLAEACGCYAKINADGNCKMVWYTDHTSSLAFALDDEFHIESADPYMGLIWDEFDDYLWNDADKFIWNDVCSYEEVFSVDSLQVRQLDSDADVDYPVFTDGNVYLIVQNPFLSVETYDDIENYIKPIWDRLQAFGGHLPVNVECVGNYLVETGDIISMDITSSVTVHAPVYVRTLRWNGSCVDTYETTGNVTREAVSASNQQKMIARNNIRFFTKDLYYGIESGIDIVPQGIEISGGKYIKLKSGAELDVESGGDVKVKSGGIIDVESGADVNVESGGNINILSGGKVDIKSGGGIDVESGGDISVKSGGSFGVASGGQIDINASGNLKLTGSTVEIKSGSTFNVDSMNFKIDSDEEYVKAGDWQLDPRGIVAEFYNSLAQTNCMIMFGRPGYVFEDTVPSINILSQVMAKYNNKYSGGYSFMLRQPNANIEYTSFDINMTPGFNPPAVTLTASHSNNGSSVAVTGTLGTSTNKWDVYGKTVRYDSLVQNSSKEVKHDIKALPSAGEKLDKLKPVTFVYDSDPEERTRQGLIYEDTVQVMPEICTDNEGEKAISYVELIPTLLKEIQDLRTRVRILEERLGE